VRRGAVREVLVVHDMACGDCARIGGTLPSLLRVPVRLRSCRDPHLRAAHPGLPAVTRGCGAPAVGIVRVDGAVCWRTGLTAAPALLGLVRPHALPGAAALFTSALYTTLRRTTVRRTSRAARADHG
jgi:hypothetical protein